MVSVNRLEDERNHPKPICLQGFERINRYWDRRNEIHAAKILPGEFYVTKHNEAVLTVLGSCVSACLRDKVKGIGGMNHFMLPVGTEDNRAELDKVGNAARYGNFAMEQLINTILSNGGKRENLEVKIFGGGKVLNGMDQIDIGHKNISFIRGYVILEGLEVAAQDLGDVYPRKVMYFPRTGKVWVKKLHRVDNKTIANRENRYKVEIQQQPIESDIELFD
ncbi:Chemotaxis protein CheD [hydrothermal vent metagenome]|uniref:Chemotaxis protein CheD n=1 Tax=hydrothermal vent metagenome TaxID=652676 RepID=A0A3B1AG57_9ZZZZ